MKPALAVGIVQLLQRPFWQTAAAFNLPHPPYNPGRMLGERGSHLYEVSESLFNGETEEHVSPAASAREEESGTVVG